MARVHIYDSKITAFSHPGGMVWKWAYQRRKRVENLAKAFAPKRTGRLASSIEGSYNKVPNGVVMYVTATAPYSIAVHEGTLGALIVPKRGRFMKLQPAWGPYPVTYKKQVAGQRPQPFLADALDTVMRDL